MPKTVLTKGPYVLNCEPLPMPDGRFSAMVVITRAKTGALITSRRFPDPHRFEKPDEAAAHAREWALDWIGRYGEQAGSASS